jgi:hypothetical protein
MAGLVMLLRMLFAASVVSPPEPMPTAVVSEETAVARQALTQEPPVWTPAPYIPPPPTVAPPVAPAAAQSSISGALAASAWPPELWAPVARIVACESGGSTTARNGVHVGVLQANVNYWGYPPADLVGQLNHGYGIYLVQGFGAWSCY